MWNKDSAGQGGGGSPGLKGGTALKCLPKRKVEMNSKVVNAEMMKERC